MERDVKRWRCGGGKGVAAVTWSEDGTFVLVVLNWKVCGGLFWGGGGEELGGGKGISGLCFQVRGFGDWKSMGCA